MLLEPITISSDEEIEVIEPPKKTHKGPTALKAETPRMLFADSILLHIKIFQV